LAVEMYTGGLSTRDIEDSVKEASGTGWSSTLLGHPGQAGPLLIDAIDESVRTPANL